jgi:hypothetical protein
MGRCIVTRACVSVCVNVKWHFHMCLKSLFFLFLFHIIIIIIYLCSLFSLAVLPYCAPPTSLPLPPPVATLFLP